MGASTAVHEARGRTQHDWAPSPLPRERGFLAGTSGRTLPRTARATQIALIRDMNENQITAKDRWLELLWFGVLAAPLVGSFAVKLGLWQLNLACGSYATLIVACHFAFQLVRDDFWRVRVALGVAVAILEIGRSFAPVSSGISYTLRGIAVVSVCVIAWRSHRRGSALSATGSRPTV